MARRIFLVAVLSAGLSAWAAPSSLVSAAEGDDGHVTYAKELWQFVHRDRSPYASWTQASTPVDFAFGPPAGGGTSSFLNKAASGTADAMPHGSIVVTQHFGADGKALTAVTIRHRQNQGYSKSSDDWYWIHYMPDGRAVASSARPGPFPRRGFVTIEMDGRLWVLRTGCEETADIAAGNEPTKLVTLIGEGPGGMTLKGIDRETLAAYVATKDGFESFIDDGRVWVFRTDSEELKEYKAGNELTKHVIRTSAGPLGMTVKAPHAEIIDEYLTAKQGFATRVVDGRLWVFREGSADLAEFTKVGEPAKYVIRVGSGPGGMTIKSPDEETILDYMAAADGFFTKVEDKRIWVFRPGSDDLKEYQKSGEPAKCVIRPGAGPLGMTVKSPDTETIQAYLRVVGS